MGNNIKIYFLIENLKEKRTGIENASLSRAKLFSKYLGWDPSIITAAYNPNLNIQRETLVKEGLIGEKNKIINMYEFFQETITFKEKNEELDLKRNSSFVYYKVNDTLDYRVLKEEKLVAYEKYDLEGNLKYKNIFVNKKKVRRDVYDSNGYLSKTENLEAKSGNVISEVYYRTSGSICMYKYYEYVNNENILMGIHLIDRKGEIIEFFGTEKELIAYWIKTYLKNQDNNILLIDKERVYYPALKDLKKDNIKIICAIHSTHLSNSIDVDNGKINSNYKQIFDDLANPNAIVVLTNSQKEHIEKRFGAQKNIFVIPHTIEKTVEKIDFGNRTDKSAIYIARYAVEKQHIHLVNAFSKVVQVHKDARLDFYGYGSMEKEIVKKIKSLNLENNVFVNSFTNNIDEIYDKTTLSLLTSRAEGFSLFLLESLSHGCPIISYNINYGPNEIIEDGANGYLVEPNDENELSQKIIELFNKKDKLKDMSDAAYLKMEKFAPEKIALKWKQMIESLLK